jgi:predicted transcriptional regulator YheO
MKNISATKKSINASKVERLYRRNRSRFFELKDMLSRPTREAYDAAIDRICINHDIAISIAHDDYYASAKTVKHADEATTRAVMKNAGKAFLTTIKTAKNTYKIARKNALIAALKQDGIINEASAIRKRELRDSSSTTEKQN